VTHRDQEKFDKKFKPTISCEATTKEDIIKPLSWRKIKRKKNRQQSTTGKLPDYADNSKKNI
jgi:hypothetical protein